MDERIKQWIIEAYRRGESLNEMRVQVYNTFNTKLTFWEINDVCDEADTGMRCVCGYIGNDFTCLVLSTHSDSSVEHDHDIDVWEQGEEDAERTTIYVCPKCGTLKIEV
jgi:hypothetical protein